MTSRSNSRTSLLSDDVRPRRADTLAPLEEVVELDELSVEEDLAVLR